MTYEEMHAVVATAHNHKLKVTGHCRATEGIKNALRAGYDCIEHGTFVDNEALDLMLQRDVPCVPAVYFEKASIELGPKFGLPQCVIDGHQETLDGGVESALKILRAGGRLGMGGDYGFGWNPHGDYARELTFFVREVGFTPLEVLLCATKTGSEIMGRDKDFGTLEPGKLADVLIVDGVRRGPSQEPVLILLHGVTRSWRDWEPMVPFLSHQWTIFAIDHRGHGQSDRASSYFVDDYAQDLIEVLVQKVGDPVVLVGHSLGAMVAAIAASKVPERVRGLVLEDPPMQTMGRSIQGTVWQKLFQGMQQVCIAGGSLEQISQRLGSISLPQADGSTAQLRTLRTEEALRWGASCLSKLDPKVFDPLIAGEWLEGLDWESIAGRIASPAILLQADFGAGGALSDPEAQAFCQGCRDCERVHFPGKNHQLHGTIPGQIAAVIDRFLAKP